MLPFRDPGRAAPAATEPGAQLDGPEFVGVSTVAGRGVEDHRGLYEFWTAQQVPVQLHDMSFIDLTYAVATRRLTLRFLYDDPVWTPPEAAATPMAVLTFDGVHVLEWEDEPPGDAPLAAWGQVSSFDYYVASGIFALSAFTLHLVFTAVRVSVDLQPVNGSSA